MTGQELRTKLATDSQLNMYWKVILGLEGFSAVMMLFVGFAAALVWIFVIIALAFIGLVMWGVYNIQRWVVILMWIGAIGSLITLLGDFNWNNLVSLAINGFTLYVYRKILAFVNPGATAPRATPPAPKV